MGNFEELIQPALGVVLVVAGIIIPGGQFLIPIGASLLVSSAIQAVARTLAPSGGLPRPLDIADRTGRTVALFNAVAPRDIVYGETMKSGPIMPIALTGADNEFFHYVLPLAGHECESIGDVYFGDRKLGDGHPIDPFVQISKVLGSPTQAADPTMLTNLGGVGWTTNHRLRGICYLYVRLTWDITIWPAGFPNVKAVVKGKKPGGAWTDNAATCIDDYMKDAMGMMIPAAKVNTAATATAETICDELVTLQGGGSPAPTQKRYTLNGVISTGAKPIEILEGLLTAMAGAFVYQQGEFRIFAGAYVAPTVTIDQDSLRGAVVVRPRPSRRERFNAVRGLFPNMDNLWEVRDFPPVTNATYEAEDGGVRLYLDIQLPFTDNPTRAQRIAKIFLERHRQSVVVEFPANLSAHELGPWDTVNVSLAQLGWGPKVFRTLDWKLAPAWGIDLVLQEEASTVYDWTAEETVIDPAPNTTLPTPFAVAAPGVPSVVESLFVTRDSSGVKARAEVSWTLSAGPFVAAYGVEHRLVGDPLWRVEPRTAGPPYFIDDITPGNTEFRVRAFNSLQVASAYSTTLTQEITALSAPPAAPTNLSLSAIGGMAMLRWDPSTEIDVRLGGKWRIRHEKVLVGAAWNHSYTIGDALSGSESVAIVPLKEGTYLVRAEDSVGVLGAVALITTKQATILDFINTNTITEHTSSPPFPGAHSNTEVDTGNLKITTTGSPVLLTGTYTFSAGFDFASVVRRRLTTDLALVISNESDLIDSRLTNIDTWESFDGDTDGAGDLEMQFRETDDDPAGSPVTWSPWKRFDSVEVQARGVEFRALLTVNDGNFNILMSELEVVADRL